MIFPIGDDQVKGGHYPYVSYALIALNVLVFLYEFTLPAPALVDFVHQWGSVPVETANGQNLHTLVTSMFLHGGWLHLIGNMLFLWVFADNIEATIGSTRFFLFYFLGGLAAHAGHIWFHTDSVIPTVGASGAISAVLGAYLVLFPSSRIKVLFFFFVFHVPALLFLGFWIFQQVWAGSASLDVRTAESAGIAYWAHIAGFIFGLLAGFYYRLQYSPILHRADRRR